MEPNTKKECGTFPNILFLKESVEKSNTTPNTLDRDRHRHRLRDHQPVIGLMTTHTMGLNLRYTLADRNLIKSNLFLYNLGINITKMINFYTIGGRIRCKQ